MVSVCDECCVCGECVCVCVYMCVCVCLCTHMSVVCVMSECLGGRCMDE